MGKSEANFYPRKDAAVLLKDNKALSGIISANVKYETASKKENTSSEYGEESIGSETEKKITLEVISSNLFDKEIFEKGENLSLTLRKDKKGRILKGCRLIFSERFASAGEEREKFIFSVSEEERDSL